MTRTNSTLPHGWWNDEVMAALAYEKIAARLREGEDDQTIARKVGVADRTVLRYRRRHNIPQQARLEIPR